MFTPWNYIKSNYNFGRIFFLGQYQGWNSCKQQAKYELKFKKKRSLYWLIQSVAMQLQAVIPIF